MAVNLILNKTQNNVDKVEKCKQIHSKERAQSIQTFQHEQKIPITIIISLNEKCIFLLSEHKFEYSSQSCLLSN